MGILYAGKIDYILRQGPHPRHAKEAYHQKQGVCFNIKNRYKKQDCNPFYENKWVLRRLAFIIGTH